MGCPKLHITEHKLLPDTTPSSPWKQNFKGSKNSLSLCSSFDKTCAGSYRFGFNGQENDNEVKGTGNSLDFGARIYDPRLGKWLSVDPLEKKYPNLSPYSFVANSPVIFIDPNGEEIVIHYKIKGKDSQISLKTVDDIKKLESIESDNDFARNMYTTLTYLIDNELSVLEENDIKVDVVKESILRDEIVNVYGNNKHNTTYEDGYESHDNEEFKKDISETSINYDPTSALKIGKGAQSPSIGFLHEILHFKHQMDDPEAYHNRCKTYNSRWEDDEEEHVIKQTRQILSRFNRKQNNDRSKFEAYRTTGYFQYKLFRSKGPDSKEEAN